jgi:predicted GNAT family acetyltransferase
LLFAQRPDAERAYRAIGFNRIGAWALDFLKETVSSL